MVSLKTIIALSFFYHGEKMTVKQTIKIAPIRSVNPLFLVGFPPQNMVNAFCIVVGPCYWCFMAVIPNLCR